MAATANGWPYVTPTDHPKDFPASSQALATKLEADVRGFKTGYWSGSADGSGNISITHGLGRTPTAMILTPGANATTGPLSLAGWRVTGFTPTTASIYIVNSSTGAAYAGVAFGFYWLVQ
jgi:hypothetical protein